MKVNKNRTNSDAQATGNILNNYLKRSYCILPYITILAVASSDVSAQLPSIPGFKSVCVTDMETGFNWKSNRWIQTNFRAGSQYIVQKINPALFESKPLSDRPASCKYTQPQTWLSWTMVSGCYLIKEMGTQKSVAMAEPCDEHFISGSLHKIQCRDITFMPDGGFIGLPPRTSINPNAKGEYNDSLVLSIGKCSKLAE